MKKMLIVEDVATQALALKTIITSYYPKTEILIATSFFEAQYLIKEHADLSLFFLDIQLSEQTSHICDGISLGLQIRSIARYKNTPIIYVTSFSDRIQEALNTVHCFGFLYKPYRSEDVTNLLNEILHATHPSQILRLKIDTSIFTNIDLSQLIYINANGHYLVYHTTNGTYTSRQYSLKQLLQKLPVDFIRCHKSYIVNQSYVLNRDTVNHYIQLRETKDHIPIGKNIVL